MRIEVNKLTISIFKRLSLLSLFCVYSVLTFSQSFSVQVYDNLTGAAIPDVELSFNPYDIHNNYMFHTDSLGRFELDTSDYFLDQDSLVLNITAKDYLSQMILFHPRIDTKLEIFLAELEVKGCGPPTLLFTGKEIQPTEDSKEEFFENLKSLKETFEFKKLKFDFVYENVDSNSLELAKIRAENIKQLFVAYGFDDIIIEIDYYADNFSMLLLTRIE